MQEFIEFIKANLLMSAIWVILLVLIIISFLKAQLSKVQSVGAQAAAILINKSDAVILDIRTNEEFRKGYILNSINIPLASVKKLELAPIEKAKELPVIVVCANGITANQAAQVLSTQGFTQVYTLKGGLNEWATNMPIIKKNKK